MSMKFINPEFQVSKSKNKKVIKVCFGTRSSGTPCIKRWMSRKKILKSKFLLTHKNPTIPLVPVIRDLSPGIIDCSLTNRLHQHERIEPHS